MKRKPIMINDLKTDMPLSIIYILTALLLILIQVNDLQAKNLIDLQNEAIKNRKVIEKYKTRMDQQLSLIHI